MKSATNASLTLKSCNVCQQLVQKTVPASIYNNFMGSDYLYNFLIIKGMTVVD